LVEVTDIELHNAQNAACHLKGILGIDKQPPRNPYDVTRDRYNDIVNLFTNLYRRVIPTLERIDVVRELANCPHIAGEFMPMVKAELDEYERDGPVESACIEG